MKTYVFGMLVVSSIVLLGCSNRLDIEKTTEQEIQISEQELKELDNYEIEGVTGEIIVNDLLNYDEYLEMAEEIYLAELDEKTGLAFSTEVGDIVCGVNDNCDVVLVDQDNGDEIVVVEGAAGYMYFQEMKIYYLELGSDNLKMLDLETGEVTTVIDGKATLPIIHMNNIYYLDEGNVFRVAGLPAC